MHIYLACPHFSPDLHAATGEVATKLVESLADLGHEITVATSLPWYKDHSVAEGWRGRPWRTESTDWGRIIRVWPFPSKKTNLFARAAGFLGFSQLLAARSITTSRVDVSMAMSPPIFLAEAAYLVAKKNKCPFVFNTQDIFPDAAVDLGILTNSKVIKILSKYESFIYKRSDAISVLSKDQSDNIGAKVKDPGKIHIIPNFADAERIQPREKQGTYRQTHGLEDKTVVMYSGNVGLSQPFELIESAATELKSNPNVVFVINGEGAARPEVEKWAKNKDNVRIVDFGPRENVPDILGAADIHLILLKKGLASSSTPSKLYSILSAARPVLAAVDADSEVAKVLRKAKAGFSVEPDNPELFVEALKKMISKADDLPIIGSNGREFATSWLSPERQAGLYCELFSKLSDRRR